MRAAALGGAFAVLAGAAVADVGSTFKEGVRLPGSDGAAIYASTCQACHLAGATGAVGAARIPALAANTKLATAGYPITVVVNGLGGMPALGVDLDDQQVAAVVAYVRTHFGNSYPDPINPADVAPMRPATGYPSSD